MEKILLVDDDTSFLFLLSNILKEQFRVYEATGVSEALKIIESVSLDLICSDYEMGDGTGLTLLESIRKKNMQTPFLLVSATNDWNAIRMVRQNGGSFCSKTDQDLIRQINIMVNIGSCICNR